MKTRNPESGFAVLFIYAMAATVAIMLFMELPRVAFEAQRDKEQLLIDRGEQYSRAVQLYVRKFGRYPADFEALDNTQNLRFLRNHYVDPMTGKDDWRLIHVGPGGVFTDSLLYNKKKDGDKAFEPQNFITEAPPTGGAQTDASQGVNIALRNRPSDQPGAPGAPADPNNPQGVPPGLNQPGLTQPGAPQFDANGQVIPNFGITPGGPNPNPGFPNQTGQTPPTPGFPPGVQPPQFPMTGQPVQSPTSTADGASLIGRLLTTPRPGGLNGLNGINGQTTAAVDANGNPIPASNVTAGAGAAQQQAAAAPTIGGGLAGVASKREQEGIKSYKDRTKYNEWEFVYDITKDQSRAGGPGAQQQQQQQQQQQGQQGQQGQQSSGSQSPTQTSQQAMAPPVIIAPPQQ